MTTPTTPTELKIEIPQFEVTFTLPYPRNPSQIEYLHYALIDLGCNPSIIKDSILIQSGNCCTTPQFMTLFDGVTTDKQVVTLSIGRVTPSVGDDDLIILSLNYGEGEYNTLAFPQF